MGRIALHDIRKRFGATEVIHGVDLAVEDGELVVFVGPSGCGKSTLLRLIAGLDRPSSGTIEIDGRDVTRLSAAERGLAMVFQSYALYPHMTVRQNLSFGLENTKMARDEVARRIDA
ncbi:ABC transporter ATP-binding protein, partial [uncultured Jannaschia sp.]|uniref:ATP-binding cassette domain-containing protein n=1 Tax=uncultured Jannaschia sp. TaxID=293347 RepID=UPI002638FBC3